MECFAGADLHKRVTQLAVLGDGQSPSQFRFPNDPKTVHGVLKKLPRGTKIAVAATGTWWWSLFTCSCSHSIVLVPYLEFIVLR
jgi:hypothetical protein